MLATLRTAALYGVEACAVQVEVDAFPDRTFAGKIEAIDPRLNPTTRNLRVRATLENRDEALRPGMFARVAVVLPGDDHVVAVPATGAYCFSLGSTYNYVPRPPVVAVRAGHARVIVRGETIEDLLARDAGILSEGDA